MKYNYFLLSLLAVPLLSRVRDERSVRKDGISIEIKEVENESTKLIESTRTIQGRPYNLLLRSVMKTSPGIIQIIKTRRPDLLGLSVIKAYTIDRSNPKNTEKRTKGDLFFHDLDTICYLRNLTYDKLPKGKIPKGFTFHVQNKYGTFICTVTEDSVHNPDGNMFTRSFPECIECKRNKEELIQALTTLQKEYEADKKERQECLRRIMHDEPQEEEETSFMKFTNPFHAFFDPAQNS